MGKAKRIKNALRQLPYIPPNIVLRNKVGDSLGVGILFAALAAMVTIHAVTTDDMNSKIGCLVFVVPLLCIISIIYTCFYFRWEVEIINNDITYCRVLGKTKKYTIDQIKRAEIIYCRGIKELYVYSEKKYLFSLSVNCFGYNDFYNLLKSRNIPIK